MKTLSLLLISLLFFALPVMAEEEEKEAAAEEAPAVIEYAYYGFEPDIITNYVTSKKKMGYIRVTVELMVKNAADLVEIEQHAPLLRAAMIEILGNQPEERIKSLSGREAIRKQCFDTMSRLLKQETGKEPINHLLFTKYLYD